MGAPINLTGRRFGFLKAVRPVWIDGVRFWECVCDCGGKSTVSAQALRCGHSKSCGCRTGGHPKPKLTASRLRKLLSYDPITGIFHWRVGKRHPRKTVAGCVTKRTGSIIISIDGKHYHAHHLAWLYIHGRWPRRELDHKNVQAGSNGIENLRLAGRSKNLANKRMQRNNKSGFKGVHLHKASGLWVAKIGFRKREIHLGYHKDKVDAARAYDDAAVRYYGEFSRTNFGERSASW